MTNRVYLQSVLPGRMHHLGVWTYTLIILLRSRLSPKENGTPGFGDEIVLLLK